MMMGEMQKPLSETKSSSDSNRADAFGVTKTGLTEGSYDVLETIFYGMRNIKISSEIMSIENPAGILADYFAACYLKREDTHLNMLNIPRDFFMLVNYLNLYSHNNKGFARLAHEFKKCFDDSPREQKKRFELLEQSVRDSFVDSFFATYKPSNKEDPVGYDFYDPNCDGTSKEVYADKIYKELKSLSDRLKN